MKRFTLAAFCLITAAAPVLAQGQKDSLASLIQSGNRKAALDRIRAGADVNEAQPDGTRPVHWAVYRVDHELLQALIARKAKVDVANDFGSTPLAEAVKLADAAMVKMLLDAGAGVEGANQDGQTALMLAIKAGELPIVGLLMKAGANVNVIEKFEGQTPLMWAVVAPKNASEMTRLLLAKDANVKIRAKYQDWPNQVTSEPRAQYRPVGGLTAMLYAARNGCYACVESLIGAGADVNLPTPEGVTPLMIALDNEHNDVARLLLEHGANPHLRDWWGRTALYIVIDRKPAPGGGGGRGGRGGGAVVAARSAGVPSAGIPSMEIINTLLAAGVDVNAELNFHRPSRGGNSGRFGEEQLNTGTTPLFRSTQSNDMEVIRALLEKGANPNINAMGFTPFLLAAGVSSAGGGTPNMALLDLMFEHGAEVNTQVTGTRSYSMRISYHPPADQEGVSALHQAAKAGRTDLVRYLLAKGANTDLIDANGKKAIDLVAPTSSRGGVAVAPAPAAGVRGGAGPAAVSPATAAEIRALLEKAASKN